MKLLKMPKKSKFLSGVSEARCPVIFIKCLEDTTNKGLKSQLEKIQRKAAKFANLTGHGLSHRLVT